MIEVRNIYQLKFGRIEQAVELFRRLPAAGEREDIQDSLVAEATTTTMASSYAICEWRVLLRLTLNCHTERSFVLFCFVFFFFVIF